MNNNSLIPLIVLTAAAGGCTLAPKYTRPEAPIPESWPSGAAYPATQPTTSPSDATQPKRQEFFRDEKLLRVIEMALKNNRDLRLAALNVQRTRALYAIQRAEVFPTLSAAGSASKQRVPADFSGTGQPMTVKQYGANIGLSAWEIDFFGRIRSLSDAAQQEYFATEQARRGAQILLVSGVAIAYLAMAADREMRRPSRRSRTGSST